MPLVAFTLVLVLVLLAVLHAYWGLGGRWPGHDDASLVEHVVGRTAGMRAPSPLACSGVAFALIAAAGLVGLHSYRVPTGWAEVLVALSYWCAALVFLIRGIAGFVPSAFRYAEGTPFYTLNRTYYGPLCLLIAAGFAAAW